MVMPPFRSGPRRRWRRAPQLRPGQGAAKARGRPWSRRAGSGATSPVVRQVGSRHCRAERAYGPGEVTAAAAAARSWQRENLPTSTTTAAAKAHLPRPPRGRSSVARIIDASASLLLWSLRCSAARGNERPGIPRSGGENADRAVAMAGGPVAAGDDDLARPRERFEATVLGVQPKAAAVSASDSPSMTRRTRLRSWGRLTRVRRT